VELPRLKDPSAHFIRGTTRIERIEVSHEPQRFISETDQEGFDLLPYVRTLRKHAGLIVVVFAVALLIGELRVMMATPAYTAEATILITAPEPDVLSAKGVTAPGSEMQGNDYETQYDILESRNLAARVIANLGLDRKVARSVAKQSPGAVTGASNQSPGAITGAAKQSPGAITGIVGDQKNRLRERHESPVNKRTSLQDAKVLERHLVDSYLNGLSIKPLRNTSLVQILYSSTDPAMAARIANAHAQAYIVQGIELHRHAKEEAADFLQQKLIELKGRLQDSEIALNAYSREHGMLSGKDAIVLDRLSDLSRDLTEARVARIGLEAQVQFINKKDYKSLPAVVSNKTIQGLQEELDDLNAENASLASEYKPTYPKLAALQAKIRGIQGQIDAEIVREVNRIESSYREGVEKEEKLQEEMNTQRTLTMNLNDASVQYAILQREVEANRELYDSLLKAMKDARVAADAATSNASLIDRAEVPEVRSSPKVKKTLGLSGVLGLVGGIGLAFLLEYVDNRIKEPEDVARYLKLPVLAMVPKYPRRRLPIELTSPLLAFSAGDKHGGTGGDGAVTRSRAYHVSAGEAYRTLRASLLLSHGGESSQTTLITSALAREGKTATAINSAVVLALSGRRVLLIDADLRSPWCHRYLAMENREGLTQVLRGSVQIELAVHPTRVDNLFFLGSGGVPRNPSELIGSIAMRRTIEQLKQEYDSVVIDSPPVMLVSDTLLLSTMADGVALVVDVSVTPRQKVKAACARLHYAKARLLGIVLNKSFPERDYYYHHPHDQSEEVEID